MKKIFIIITLILISFLTACVETPQCCNEGEHIDSNSDFVCDVCHHFFEPPHTECYDSDCDKKCDECELELEVINHTEKIRITSLAMQSISIKDEHIGVAVKTNRIDFQEYLKESQVASRHIERYLDLKERCDDTFFENHWLLFISIKYPEMSTTADIEVFQCLNNLYVEISNIQYGGWCAEEVVYYVLEIDKDIIEFEDVHNILKNINY